MKATVWDVKWHGNEITAIYTLMDKIPLSNLQYKTMILRLLYPGNC